MPGTNEALNYTFKNILQNIKSNIMTKCVMHVKQILGLLLKIKSIPNIYIDIQFHPCVLIQGIYQKKFGKTRLKLIFKFLVDLKKSLF